MLALWYLLDGVSQAGDRHYLPGIILVISFPDESEITKKRLKMALEQIADKVVETDVLVIGGGIAGCPAAAKAAEHGLSVTLVEKSKLERSGNAAMGINYYTVGAIPGEGMTPLEMVKRWEAGPMMGAVTGEGRFADQNIMYRRWERGLWAVEELEKLGIPMRWFDGEFRFVIDRVRLEEVKVTLQVRWQNVKPLMAAAVRKRGVNILERTMVIDLLTNKGRVVGATAVNTRTGEFTVIKAKATVIATGIFARCYEGEQPLFWKYKFRYHWNPATCSGDGYAVAYRAGAELVNMDITGCASRNHDELTMGFGLLAINDGIPGKLLNWRGEEVPSRAQQSAKVYAETEQKGLTPLYESIEHLPDDFHKRMEVYLRDMRLATFKLAEERGFNPKTHRYQIMLNKPHQFGLVTGINIDEDYRASLKGLYAIGDCAAGCHGCYMAVPGGFLVGDSIHKFVGEAGEPVVDEGQVERQKQTALAPLSVKDGTEPMELECAIRYICERYISQFKSEGKLREGLRRLGSLRRVFLPKLIAKNPHYLMRCLECRNILDLVEVHINACLERKETRGNHIRLDYPERDPTRDNMITTQRLENGRQVLEIREVPELKPEYAKRK